MAIINTEHGEIEVRIKRYPDDTYYEEYIKVEGKERHNDERRERYIIPEPGTTYYIEATLKKNFDFGGTDRGVEVALFFPGNEGVVSFKDFYPSRNEQKLNKDLTFKLDQVNSYDIDWKVHGTRFCFRKVEIGQYQVPIHENTKSNCDR